MTEYKVIQQEEWAQMQKDMLHKAYEVLEANVRQGEQWLDENHPGWYKKIDLSDLDMENGHKCICGWVFKDKVGTILEHLGARRIVDTGYEYFAYCEEGQSNVNGTRLGFLSAGIRLAGAIPTPRQYSILAELWTEKIEKRLANDGLLGT